MSLGPDSKKQRFTVVNPSQDSEKLLNFLYTEFEKIQDSFPKVKLTFGQSNRVIGGEYREGPFTMKVCEEGVDFETNLDLTSPFRNIRYLDTRLEVVEKRTDVDPQFDLGRVQRLGKLYRSGLNSRVFSEAMLRGVGAHELRHLEQEMDHFGSLNFIGLEAQLNEIAWHNRQRGHEEYFEALQEMRYQISFWSEVDAMVEELRGGSILALMRFGGRVADLFPVQGFNEHSSLRSRMERGIGGMTRHVHDSASLTVLMGKSVEIFDDIDGVMEEAVGKMENIVIDFDEFYEDVKGSGLQERSIE